MKAKNSPLKQGFADRLPLRGAGLLGRRGRQPHHLPRPHPHHQDLLPRNSADHRGERLRRVALPGHSQHREPLLDTAAAEDGGHIQGQFLFRVCGKTYPKLP